MAETLQSKSIKISFTDQQIIDGLRDTKDGNRLRLLENQFYKRYVSYIYKVAINKCRNFGDAAELAQDITQETFIKAFKAIKNFTFPSEAPIAEHGNIIKAWLGKIGNNCFLKVYAERKNEISIEDDSVEIDDVFCPLCCEILIIEKFLLH